MYTAMLYLVFEWQDRRLGHRILKKLTIGAKILNQAKAQVTRFAKKDDRYPNSVSATLPL